MRIRRFRPFPSVRLSVALAVVAGALLAAPPGAVAALDRTGAVTPAVPFTWVAPPASGQNQDYDAATGEVCDKTVAHYCDITLLDVQAGDFFATSGGGVEISIGGAPGHDLDLYVYRSDGSGARGELVGASTSPIDEERVTLLDASGFYLVQVVYWDATNTSYSGRAEFFRRAKFPPDIDRPLGLQDTLASDPRLGFRSHSEPHIAQSPLNSDLLIAASKMYNRDRDSLPEYEFKIGTYVSFDRGRHWSDLAQLNVCPQQQTPPSSWPQNRCYPADDPNRAGTGPEDAGDGRPGGDFGEEYTTSDPWVEFDDEGNAYAMVLDSPPFPSGTGWGMSLHRWETPSRRDVRRGRTWSDRIPINAYPEAAEDPEFPFLDDKNTMAVNNAGRDRDGRPGIIVACWGQNGPVLEDRGPQQEVCKRSTNGGRTWGALTPVSPGDQRLVIGIHVVADTRDRNTFYAVWLEYLSGLLDGSGTNTYYFSKSTDGGQTWSAATPVQRILPLPNIFPRQAFRNLSLPIMAVGPRGQLYLTYADYNPATAPTPDEDGMQADIKLTKSLDGGASWTAPAKVNQDTTNADQFQPYVRVTPRGQVNVSFFDRRLDRPNPPEHPGNFFIDTWLARSNDGGASWRETRVSHDSWDPSINPPISGSGEFIGDYQGLVADDCAAIPFVNDTHLANDPRRDPLFDRGEPRSPFQEVFSWTVPNTRRFGRRSSDCEDHHHGDGGHNGVRRARGEAATRAARAARASARILAHGSRDDAIRLARKHQIVTERPAVGR